MIIIKTDDYDLYYLLFHLWSTAHISSVSFSIFSHVIFKVRVDLIETPHVCSSASRRGRYRQEVKLGPQTTRSVPFVIIPMKDEEDYPIEVKAAVKDSSLYDGVMRKLRVVVGETHSA